MAGAPWVVTWLFSELGWLGRLIKNRLFRSKLRSEQSVRLTTLLDDINNLMSYSYVHSPFYVWHSISNEFSEAVRMEYGYHGAVYSWLLDLKAQFEDPAFNNMLLFPSLSKAILEANKLAERAKRDFEELLRKGTVSEQQLKSLRKDWDSSRSQFNQWIGNFRALFKALNSEHKLSCVDYFRPIAMVE